MTNKIPYIISFGRCDITQEQAETEIFTTVKVFKSYMKYIDLLNSQLKIQDSTIKRLTKQTDNLRVLNRILWVGSLCGAITFILRLLS